MQANHFPLLYTQNIYSVTCWSVWCCYDLIGPSGRLYLPTPRGGQQMKLWVWRLGHTTGCMWQLWMGQDWPLSTTPMVCWWTQHHPRHVVLYSLLADW